MLRDAAPPPAEAAGRMIDEAARSCARIAEIAEELSALARLGDATAGTAGGSVDVFGLAADLAAVRRADSPIAVVFRGPSSGASVAGDRDRLRTALDAVTRAVIREQAADTVVIDCRLSTGGGATILIAPERDVDAAWLQGGAPFDEYRGGMGLALPLARCVIEQHGGRIESRQAAETPAQAGRGAIAVTFPLAG
jgi:signal transduction histidine kinase